jgi:multidrug efflux system membrane fusion protein
MGHRINRRWVRRTMVAVAAAVVVGATAATATGVGLFSGDEAGGADSTDRPPATAQVTRQKLVELRTESGELGYGATTAVSGRLPGTLTGLPAIGTAVSRGKALYRVDNAPVVLLYGGLPAYRALSSGTEGADVKQFEENLQALGYSGFTVDEEYTSSTATTVSKWQKDLGLTETGTVELGRVVYASGAVRVEGHKAASGDPVGPGQPVLTYTGSAQVITVELAYDDRPLTKTGSVVTVTLPNGKSAPAKVTGSVVVISPAASAEEEDTTIIEVTVGVDDPAVLAGHEQTTLDVAFVVAERDNVLTVPVAALLALAEGGYGVELVEGDSTRTVAVTTGLFAGGRVEVTGDGVTEGATVGMPS